MMDRREELKKAGWIAGIFLLLYALPVGRERFDHAVLESLLLVRWYAREHVVLCLLPAFLIAGAIASFVQQGAVMRYLGAGANRLLAYGVAAVSGSILAVCSCTVLPLFAGIHRRGAGLGPAIAFLYSGPAINVLAIILTAKVLGFSLGLARAVGAIAFSVIIGLSMELLFLQEERARQHEAAAKAAAVVNAANADQSADRLGPSAAIFASMVAILVFANWAEPSVAAGAWQALYAAKWWLTAGFALLLAILMVRWLGARWAEMGVAAVGVTGLALVAPANPQLAFAGGVLGLTGISLRGNDRLRDWGEQSWSFAKQILPLLLLGVLAAGFFLGRPGGEGVIPSEWVSRAVGGNGVLSNLFASVAGAFMYFATLTEVPILQGLLGNGMGHGPALALLLAGPALSLPNMLVIRSVIGTRKTVAYVGLVVVMATITGWAYGAFVG